MKHGKMVVITRESETPLIIVSKISHVDYKHRGESKMDRSNFILAKDFEALQSDVRKSCCDSLMFVVYDYEQVNCEKYGFRPEWVKYAGTFQKNMKDCLFFKRDRKCCLANLM